MTSISTDHNKRRARRAERYRALDFLQHHSTLARVRQCSRRRIDGDRPVEVWKNADGSTHYANLQRCGSVWSCPVCLPKIRSSRAEEVRRAVAMHLEQGGGVELTTVTVQHFAGMALRMLLGAVSEGWRQLFKGRAGRDLQNRSHTRAGKPIAGYDYGRPSLVWMIRSLEVTHGANGWHPHLHVVMFFDRPLTSNERWAFRCELHRLWVDQVVPLGAGAPDLKHGVHMEPIRSVEDLAEYMTEWEKDHVLRHGRAARDAGKAGLEVARSDLKNGTNHGRTPYELLRDVVATGDADDLDLWREYERCTKGKRAIHWSQGMKAHFGITDTTDEEEANAEVGGLELVYSVPWVSFRVMRRTRGALERVLSLGEDPLGEVRICEYLETLDVLDGTERVMLRQT